MKKPKRALSSPVSQSTGADHEAAREEEDRQQAERLEPDEEREPVTATRNAVEPEREDVHHRQHAEDAELDPRPLDTPPRTYRNTAQSAAMTSDQDDHRADGGAGQFHGIFP